MSPPRWDLGRAAGSPFGGLTWRGPPDAFGAWVAGNGERTDSAVGNGFLGLLIDFERDMRKRVINRTGKRKWKTILGVSGGLSV